MFQRRCPPILLVGFMDKVILSLFDYSGNWPSPYKEAGYDVYQIDIKHGIDILSITPDDLPHNIMAF